MPLLSSSEKLEKNSEGGQSDDDDDDGEDAVCEEGQVATRVPPYLFKGGIESQAMIDAHTKFTCPLQGAVFIKKLTATATDAKDDNAKKTRPKAPDLEAVALALAAESKSKAKTKAKGKAKAKVAKKDQAPEGSKFETVDEIKEDFVDSTSGDRRQRMWLDDPIGALSKVLKFYNVEVGFNSSPRTKLFATLLSMCLEFAITDKVTIMKKY